MKKCNGCKEDKEDNCFRIKKTQNNKYNLNYICKVCEAARWSKWALSKAEKQVTSGNAKMIVNELRPAVGPVDYMESFLGVLIHKHFTIEQLNTIVNESITKQLNISNLSVYLQELRCKILNLNQTVNQSQDCKIVSKDEKVYFIKNAENQHIKIGYSINPEQRVGQLQTGSSSRLELICYMNGGAEKEKELHELFKNCRIANSEWFVPDENMSNMIIGIKMKYSGSKGGRKRAQNKFNRMA